MNQQEAQQIRDDHVSRLMDDLGAAGQFNAAFIQRCMEHAYEAGVADAIPIAESAAREAIAQSAFSVN